MPVYRRSEDFVSRSIAGETVIVPVSDNVARLNWVFILNEVGARIWELLEAAPSREQIERTVSDEFSAPDGALTGDIDAFLDSLRQEGLVQTAP